MSGLTLGLTSLSLVDLEVLTKAGQPQDKKNAVAGFAPWKGAFCTFETGRTKALVDMHGNEVKNLIKCCAEDETPIRILTIRRIPRVEDSLPLYDILNQFQKGHSHMAAVVKSKHSVKDSARNAIDKNDMITININFVRDFMCFERVLKMYNPKKLSLQT
ncbi:hypothetical protein HYC85_001226 [Camellia sinensis]|uniref:Uncharacterized protein n=1 Tax=Camellia sinensis TaxID=4442 RepID=A0A7J7I613_CAMSI|nr:hypothetical protein HYC85_001226 [Camellia sinensis]